MRTYVILDPQHEYGVALVAAIRRRFGLDPIVVHQSGREALFRRSTYPELERGLVGRYTLDRWTLAEVAQDIRRRGHDVVGIVPYFEQGIVPMSELMVALGISWNDPATLLRFRDKHALKAFVARRRPDLPLGLSRRVESASDVLAGERTPNYVVKPNDGFANRDIGFFGAATPRAELEAYFRHNPGPAVLEELFVGTEYAVNGQMDGQGRAAVVNVTRYERVPANGKPNVYHRTVHVPRQDAAFAPLAAYAKSVMEATDLCRCPFHMELMLTDAGPRLIEVAARFGGTRYAFMANDVHGGALDVFALAAHHYISGEDFGDIPFDWDHYDRIHYVHLDGISTRSERVVSVEGIEAVEALPEFRGWVVKPAVGARLVPTLDLYQVPYSVHLSSPVSDRRVREAAEEVKRLVVFNRDPSLGRRLVVGARTRAKSARFRAAWLAERLVSRLRRAT